MGFRDEIEKEPVNSLPIRDAVVVGPDTSIREAIGLMRARALGCAVIVDQAGTPQGIFTEQALLDVLTREPTLNDLKVSDFTDPAFLSVDSSEPISRVWDAIVRDGLRFVCVTDESGKLIGITGQRGMSEYLAECFPQQVFVQRLGSTPWMQQREGA